MPIIILISVNLHVIRFMTKLAKIPPECARRTVTLASLIGLLDSVFPSALKTLLSGLTLVDR